MTLFLLCKEGTEEIPKKKARSIDRAFLGINIFCKDVGRGLDPAVKQGGSRKIARAAYTPPLRPNRSQAVPTGGDESPPYG